MKPRTTPRPRIASILVHCSCGHALTMKPNATVTCPSCGCLIAGSLLVEVRELPPGSEHHA